MRGSRPLSPFWIYRFGWTMSLSGAHRLTGMALSLGAPLFVAWLIAIAAGPEVYARFAAGMRSGFGLVVYAGFIFCIVYHLCNGLRHLGWDAAWGMDKGTAKTTGGLVAVAVLTLFLILMWASFGGEA